MVTTKKPKRTTSRSKKTTSARSKKLSKMYKDEFDDFEDDSEPSFKMPASATPGRGKAIFFSLILGILIGAGVALFYGQYQMDVQNQDSQKLNEMNSKLSPEDKVAKLLRYDSEKKPVVSIVKDVSLIKDYPIYQFAQNGDHVIVYNDITILYDETNNKIVSAIPQDLLKEYAKIEKSEKDSEKTDEAADEENNDATDESAEENTDETSADDAPAIAAKDLEVEVRNGTSTAGLAGKRSKELTDEYGYDVTPANAAKSTYKESILVDLSDGGASAHMSDIRKTLDISKVVTELPTGESASTADVVIILAK